MQLERDLARDLAIRLPDAGSAEGDTEANDAEPEPRARSTESLLLAAEPPKKARTARIARRNTCKAAWSAILASVIRHIARQSASGSANR